MQLSDRRFQNLRVYARRLDIVIDDSKLRNYVKVCEIVGLDVETRTGAMFVCAGITLKDKGYGGKDLYSPYVVALAHNLLNRDETNIVKAVGIAWEPLVDKVPASIVADATEILNRYIVARTKEHARPSLTSFILNKVRG